MNPIVALLAAATLAQPGPVVPLAAVAPESLALSETARLALAIEGPAPLRVELPADPSALLAPVSAAVWRIRPAGPVVVTALPGGRERWEQAYRVDPYAAGEKVPLAFAPVRVTAGTDLNAQNVTWPAKELRVFTTTAATKADDARPVTGIEELPVIPPPPPQETGRVVLAALGAVFAAVLVAALVRRWRAKPPPLSTHAWAGHALGVLERDIAAHRLAGAAECVAAILREYIERTLPLPARKMTTAELASAVERAGWPAERVAELRDVLERCDRAKFAADVPTAAEAAALAARARGWVDADRSPNAGPPLHSPHPPVSRRT